MGSDINLTIVDPDAGWLPYPVAGSHLWYEDRNYRVFDALCGWRSGRMQMDGPRVTETTPNLWRWSDPYRYDHRRGDENIPEFLTTTPDGLVDLEPDWQKYQQCWAVPAAAVVEFDWLQPIVNTTMIRQPRMGWDRPTYAEGRERWAEYNRQQAVRYGWPIADTCTDGNPEQWMPLEWTTPLIHACGGPWAWLLWALRDTVTRHPDAYVVWTLD